MMKKIILLILSMILVACASHFKAPFKDNYQMKVEKAYNFLVDHNFVEEPVIVSDSIHDITPCLYKSLYTKKDNLIERKYNKEFSIFIDSIFHKNIFRNKNYYYPIKKTLNNHTKKAKEIIFFSQAKDSILTAEVVQYKNLKEILFCGMEFTTKYLFIFKNGIIDKVYYCGLYYP